MRPTGWLLLGLIALLLGFLTAPNRHRGRMSSWRGQRFAHRGLHDLGAGIVENTLEAFEAACVGGYGMELDVQMTGDGQLVVFHDDDLSRMAGDPRRVDACTLNELRAIQLMDVPGARIPTLQAVLSTVRGRGPLLVELKNGRHNRALCQGVMALLRDYPGPYIVESFNPLMVCWFRRNAPKVVRGQLVGPMKDYRADANQIGAFAMAGLLLNALSRPDFVAYDCNAHRFFSPHFQRFIFHTPLAAWTVRSDSMQALIEARGEISIFEGIRP